MVSTSPHLYRKTARDRGIETEVVERALNQAQEPERRGFPAILTLNHLAHLTGARYEYLRSIVSRSHDGYTPFTIRKKSGGLRYIAAPEPELLCVQRWICRSILAKHSVHHASTAYQPGSAPFDAASRHVGAAWLIKIDIHDFFESISERRAYFAFRGCGYQPLPAFELARLCTRLGTSEGKSGPIRWPSARRSVPGAIPGYHSLGLGHLPQGAPTSPMLSNIVSVPLDETLCELGDRYGLTYTRYSDDIAFSTGGEFSRRDANTLIRNAGRILASFGHELHRNKITIAPPGARKVVLGLLVDGDTVRLTRAYRSRLEDHVRGVEKFGLKAHAATRHFSSLWGAVRHIDGLIAHAKHVDETFARSLKHRFSEALVRSGWSGEAPQSSDALYGRSKL